MSKLKFLTLALLVTAIYWFATPEEFRHEQWRMPYSDTWCEQDNNWLLYEADYYVWFGRDIAFKVGLAKIPVEGCNGRHELKYSATIWYESSPYSFTTIAEMNPRIPDGDPHYKSWTLTFHATAPLDTE